MEIKPLVLKTQSILNAPNYLQLMEEAIDHAWRDFFKNRPLIKSVSYNELGKKIDAEQKLAIRSEKKGAYLSISKDEKRIYLETCDYRGASHARPLIWSTPL